MKFFTTFKDIIYKKNNSSFYLGYFNQLVDQYNNTSHHSIDKKSAGADFSALSKEIESTFKAPKFKVGDKKNN